MPHSFVAYIDESGDDGFKKFREPGQGGGSSTWLVISACVFRKTRTLEAVSWRDEITRKIPERKGRTLHFAELNHNQRVVAAQVIASKPLKFMGVLAAKRPIPEGIYTQKNQLYFYMTRYLIERISWFCRDIRRMVPEGDGRVAITFSRRGGMSYGDFQDYLRRLQGEHDDSVRIHWPVIDIDAVEARDHSTSASLQIADVGASAFAAGLEPNTYGNCETRYAEILKPVTYRRKGNFLSYGVKIVPQYEDCALTEEQMKMINLFKK